MKTQVMKRAWELAKQGAKDFGGKVKEYFQQALVIAWGEVKTVVSSYASTLEEVAHILNTRGLHRMTTKANVWEKHGLRRIYITVDEVKGYLQFDENNKISKHFMDTLYNFKVRGEVNALVSLYNRGELHI